MFRSYRQSILTEDYLGTGISRPHLDQSNETSILMSRFGSSTVSKCDLGYTCRHQVKEGDNRVCSHSYVEGV